MSGVENTMKQDRLPALSEAQTEIMNVIWEHGEASLTQVCTALSGRELARNTIQTQLARLEEKGWLLHRSEGKAFLYSATVVREYARSRVVQKLVDAVFGGSAEGLVLSLLDGRRLTKEEADRIRKMIVQAENNQTNEESK